MSTSSGTSVFRNMLIWFGAAISIAEIMTGTYYATLGMMRGLEAIVIGHIIGGILLFGAGLIGAKERKSAMETVKSCFGGYGAMLFIILNIVQLVGWTAIMIYDGSISAAAAFGTAPELWAAVIGVLILGWLYIGLDGFTKINTVVMAALFIMCLVLGHLIWSGSGESLVPIDDSLSFSSAIELSIAMPLSWLPLISDYSRRAKKPVAATAASAITYCVISMFMYVIGMSAAMYTGETNIALLMTGAGLGVVGLFVVVFSTVTTTFMDAYSAGVSSESLSSHIKGRGAAVVVTIVGTIAAMLYPMDNIMDFLFFIGSVFGPMISVLLANYFFLKRRDVTGAWDWGNVIVWLIGFAAYRELLTMDMPWGPTLWAMGLTMVLTVIAGKLRAGRTVQA